MLPLIIIAKEKKSFSTYLNNFISKNKIPKNLIFEVQPFKEEIGIKQIKEIKKFIDFKTQAKKLFVFYSFNKATIESQNAFLKTLEEKSANNFFILKAASLNHILPTIISRGKIIYLEKIEKEQQEDEKINLNSLILKKRGFSFFTNKLFLIETKEEGKKIILSLIYQLQERQKKEIHFNLSLLIKKGIELLNLLENNNLSPQLTVDNYLILIKKTFNINNINE